MPTIMFMCSSFEKIGIFQLDTSVGNSIGILGEDILVLFVLLSPDDDRGKGSIQCNTEPFRLQFSIGVIVELQEVGYWRVQSHNHEVGLEVRQLPRVVVVPLGLIVAGLCIQMPKESTYGVGVGAHCRL